MILFLLTNKQQQKVPETVPVVQQVTPNVPSLKKIKAYMAFAKIKNISLALKQIKLETGNLSHVIGNNLFGMRRAGERPTTAIGYNKGFAVYANWQSSVIDYYLLQQFHKHYMTNFCLDSNYLVTLNRVRQ